MRVLLVDDDRDLGRLLAEYFAPHGVELVHVESGDAGVRALERRDLDVVLLDVMLPGDDGFVVCARIRAAYDVPIVMLTARGDDADRIAKALQKISGANGVSVAAPPEAGRQARFRFGRPALNHQ